MEVKYVMECTIWSVASVSVTQSMDLKASLFTILAEKIECSKLGLKDKVVKVPNMVLMRLDREAMLA